MIYDKRVRCFKFVLKRENIDLGIVLAGPNMRYLTGYTTISLERFIGYIVHVDSNESVLIIPELEKENAERSARVKNLELLLYKDDEDPFKLLGVYLKDKSYKIIGVEGSMPYRFIYKMSKNLDSTSFIIIDGIFSELRITKDKEEIDFLRKAAEINMKSMIEGIMNISEGITEKRLVRIIRDAALDYGAEETPFTIIQSGPNTSMPHKESSERVIKRNDVVLLDTGATYKGYVSDITRTVVLGNPSKKNEKIFWIVKKAQEEAISIIKPGITAHDVDYKARSVIEGYGYGRYFIHRTGHGIGLEVHEEPYIKSGNNLVLKEGMVFTVEPGIYLHGEFGIRIEDNIIVTKDGFYDLTTLPKSLNIKDYEEGKKGI